MHKHSFDGASFVLGLVLSGGALAYLVADLNDRQVQAGWLFPLLLIGLGVAAVAAGIGRAVRRPEADEPAPNTAPSMEAAGNADSELVGEE